MRLLLVKDFLHMTESIPTIHIQLQQPRLLL